MNDQERAAAERYMSEKEGAGQQPPPPEKPTSLGKASHLKDGPPSDEQAIPHGYIEIFAEHFPSQGSFYPAGVRFFVRALPAADIRHFSTIDETNPFSVDEALTDVVKAALHVKGGGKLMSFKDLCEEDRIHIVLAIKEVTFAKGENRLAVATKCRSCQADNDLEIRNANFQRNEVEPQVAKYYDETKRLFAVRTKSFGIVEVRPPSIGVMMEVTKYIQRQRQEGKELDASFIKLIPYLVPEWRGFDDKRIKQLEVEVLGWSREKFSFFNALVEKLRVGVKEALYGQCVQCGSELEAPVTFPGGVKALFLVSDLASELL